MYAVIDIETTGGNASRDRITEIAVILHDGQKEQKRFSSLVNPEVPIPPYITDITGITNKMVADAPRFFEIAKEIVQLTEGCIFVAHNVNFDYSFIREEFRRLAYDYQREKLCTVKTSRQLIPGHASYSLGRLCESLGIPLRDRHRAMGDAEATALLLELLMRTKPVLKGKAARDPYADLPVSIPRKTLSVLPEQPGIYYFHDETGKLLRSEKSANIRLDALRNLKEGKKDGSAEFVRDITWELTGSELLAALRLLSESENSMPGKAARNKAAVYAYHDQRNYLRLAIGPIVRGREHVAEFPKESDAKSALESRMRKHALCGVLLGFEQAGKPCTRFPAGGCEGACMGQEEPGLYNARVSAALEGLGFPFARFLLVSDGRDQSEVAVLNIDNGACTGMGFLDASLCWENPEEVTSLLQPFQHPRAGGDVVRQFLPKLKVGQFHPY